MIREIKGFWFPGGYPYIADLNRIGPLVGLLASIAVWRLRDIRPGDIHFITLAVLLVFRFIWAAFSADRRINYVVNMLREAGYYEAAEFYGSRSMAYHANFLKLLPYRTGAISFMAALAYVYWVPAMALLKFQ